MPWLIAAVIAAVAIAGFRSRSSRARPRVAGGWHDPSKKEWIVLPVGPGPNGTCVLLDETPSELRTEFGSTIHWVVYGSCSGGHTIEIKRPFKKDGTDYEIFEDHGTDVTGPIPTSETGAPLRLRGKLKGRLDVAKYTYMILIDGRPARSAARASEDGDVYVCPVWPCD